MLPLWSNEKIRNEYNETEYTCQFAGVVSLIREFYIKEECIFQ